MSYSANSGMMVKMVMFQKCENTSEFMILNYETLRSFKLEKSLIGSMVETFYRSGSSITWI